MINWGDWQQMPDYRQFMNPNAGKSPIGALARTLDPMTYIPGANQIANPVHGAATAGIEAGNRVLSPVVQAAHQFTDLITPGLKQVRENIPMLQNVHRFAESNPVDTAAIIAGTIFSGGAGAGAMGGAGGAAGGAGAMGAYGGAAAGALESGAFSGLGAGLGAGSTAAVGGAAANALQDGAFSGLGAGTGNAGLLGSLKAAYGAASPYLTAYDAAKNVSNFAGPDYAKIGQRQMQVNLSERLRNDQINPELPNNPMMPADRRKRIANAMITQRLRGGF